MPKMKSNRAALKRFRVTGKGKLMRRRSWGSHLMVKKSSRRKRLLRRPALVSPMDAKRVRRMIIA